MWWYLAYMPIFTSLATVMASMYATIVSIASCGYVYANYVNIANIIYIIHYDNIVISNRMDTVSCQMLSIL